jgi:hypothetical protein
MIQKTEIKFHLDQGWGDFQNLWLIKYELGKAYNGYLVKGIIEWEEVVEGKYDIKKLVPFMRVPRHFPIQEMVDALTKTKPATTQIETTSELRATRYHLEDLRKLLNLSPKETKEV